MPVVSLSSLKSYLNITRTNDDSELADFLYDAIEAVEDVIGPMASRSVTEELYGSGPRIVLSHTPVLSVESVSVEPWLGATPVDDTAGWRLNAQTGVLRRVIGFGTVWPYLGPGTVHTVTYSVGRADVPGPVNRAILMQAASMWKSQRGASPLPANQQQAQQPMPYAGNTGFLGADVMELLAPYLPPPGVA